MNKIKISFLIVNYFSAEYTLNLCKSIASYITEYDYEILIADNSCDSRQQEELSKITDKNCRLFFPERNLGFVMANNYLHKKAEGKILILINPDTLLIDSSIQNACRFLLADKEIGIVGPYLLNDDFTYQVSFFKFPTVFSTIKEHILLYKNPYVYRHDLNKQCDCDVVKGACLLIKRNVADELELFDEDYVMYSEETDLCLRVRRLGYRVIYFPESRIIHYGEKSSSQQQSSEYAMYNYYRSKLVFFRKHSSGFVAGIIKTILLVSLLGKTMLLFLANKSRSSELHFLVLRKVLRRNWS